MASVVFPFPQVARDAIGLGDRGYVSDSFGVNRGSSDFRPRTFGGELSSRPPPPTRRPTRWSSARTTARGTTTATRARTSGPPSLPSGFA